MKKNDYLSLKVVSEFIVWMSNNLDNETFCHVYENRQNGNIWRCNSLYNAYENYRWNFRLTIGANNYAGNDFQNNSIALNAVKQHLVNALKNLINNETVIDAAIKVMQWGGVVAGNATWLQNQNKLQSILQATKNALDKNNDEHPVLQDAGLRFNAGMTKVYSLICENFVIYDSRVAAALGWAVVKFCQANNIQSVPEALRFPWAPPHEGPNAMNRKLRNPAKQGLTFPRLQSGPCHAKWNLRASWLLNAILQHPNAVHSEFNTIDADTRLRALEAALFMIGYDLGKHTQQINQEEISTKINSADQPAVGINEYFVECFTLADKNKFFYEIKSDSIEVFKENGINDFIFSFDVIFNTLKNVETTFKKESFPLSNDAVKVREGTAAPGLGTAYYKACNYHGNPTRSSKLAALLEDLQFIIPVDPSIKRNRRWTINEIFSDNIEYDSLCNYINKFLEQQEEL